MRLIGVILIAVGVILIAIAFLIPTAGGQSTIVPCATPTHAHRTSDYRIALVRVLEVTPCGFTYEDLEEHSVAAEAITTNLDLFKLGSAEFESKLMTVRLTRTIAKKDAFGVLVYCSYCRAGLLMETTAGK